MKTIFTLFLSLCTIYVSLAQITNGSFESWTPVSNYEKPDFWNTNQDSTWTRVYKDTISVEGEYSLRLSPDSPSAWTDCRAYANIDLALVEPVEEGEILSFYYKTSPLVPDQEIFFMVLVYTYQAGSLKDDITFSGSDTNNEFEKIQLPPLTIGTDSLQIRIISGAINGAADGCHNQTTAWVDHFQLSRGPNSNENIYKEDLLIYPNPNNGSFYVQQAKNTYDRYRILDLLGREISIGKLTNNNIQITRKGHYFIQLFSGEGKQNDVVRKVIVD